MSLRIWLAGSRSFGAAVFDSLSSLPKVKIVGATVPWSAQEAERWSDRLTGRYCTHGVNPVWVRSLGIDLIVSAHNLQHISAEARQAARHGAIGWHPSLLPRHRGPSAVEWTVTMRDEVAGGSVYRMDEGWDTGPVILQDCCPMEASWTASDLWRERLFGMGVNLLTKVVQERLFEKNLSYHPQNETFATSEPKWTPERAREWELVHGSALGAY